MLPLAAGAPAPDRHSALGATARLCPPTWSQHSVRPHSLAHNSTRRKGKRSCSLAVIGVWVLRLALAACTLSWSDGGRCVLSHLDGRQTVQVSHESILCTGA